MEVLCSSSSGSIIIDPSYGRYVINAVLLAVLLHLPHYMWSMIEDVVERQARQEIAAITYSAKTTRPPYPFHLKDTLKSGGLVVLAL